jgi:hypothetical protein
VPEEDSVTFSLKKFKKTLQTSSPEWASISETRIRKVLEQAIQQDWTLSTLAQAAYLQGLADGIQVQQQIERQE